MPHEADLGAMALDAEIRRRERRAKDLFDESQGIYPPAGKCLACEFGPAYKHNWIEGQCAHATQEIGDLAC